MSLDLAMGAMTLQAMPLRSPSIESTLPSPTRPILAELENKERRRRTQSLGQAFNE